MHARHVRTALAIAVVAAATFACSSPIARAPGGAPRLGADAPAVPTVFAESVISDANEQWRITFSADGRTAWFAESPGFFPITRQATIHTSTFRDGAWTEPVVASFSGQWSDIDPFISPDGRRLYFSSIRPVNGVMHGDIDLWMVERTRDGWGEPIHLGPEVNTTGADELYPSVSADGTLWFASGPPAPMKGRHWDIYHAKRSGDGFSPRVRLGNAINTEPSATDPHLQAAWEFNPEISVDGKTLVFTSLRPGGFGFGDLYVSHFVDGEWAQARNLGPVVNTAADEYHPTLSHDRRQLWFARRVSGRGNFYWVSTSGIEALHR